MDSSYTLYKSCKGKHFLYCRFLKDLMVENYVTNPWVEVELTLENRLIRGGCLRAYKHMIKFTLNQCGTLGS